MKYFSPEVNFFKVDNLDAVSVSVEENETPPTDW